MTDYELKKLKREELLELLVAQGKENESLQAKINEAEKALHDRRIALEKAGSIAEASLQLNGVIQAAESAAAQYLENIQRLSGEQEEKCARMEEESRRKADMLLADTEASCRRMERDTKEKCEAMVLQAKQESQDYWKTVSEKLEAFGQAHAELRELLAMKGKENSKP